MSIIGSSERRLPTTAASRIGAAEEIRHSAGARLGDHDRARFEEARTKAEAGLGHDEFFGFVEQGAAMSVEETVSYARQALF